jgi:hypothetical protein
MVPATLPLLKVSMCYLYKSSNTSLCVCMRACTYIHPHTHEHFYFSSCAICTLIRTLSHAY